MNPRDREFRHGLSRILGSGCVTSQAQSESCAEPQLSNGAAIRARAEHGLRKCEAPSEMPAARRRSKRIYGEVTLAITYSEAARLERCDESTVRGRIDNPKKRVPFDAIYTLPPRQRRRVAEDLLDSADEDEEVRRVG